MNASLHVSADAKSPTPAPVGHITDSVFIVCLTVCSCSTSSFASSSSFSSSCSFFSTSFLSLDETAIDMVLLGLEASFQKAKSSQKNFLIYFYYFKSKPKQTYSIESKRGTCVITKF
jgi:hypothetical protein